MCDVSRSPGIGTPSQGFLISEPCNHLCILETPLIILTMKKNIRKSEVRVQSPVSDHVVRLPDPPSPSLPFSHSLWAFLLHLLPPTSSSCKGSIALCRSRRLSCHPCDDIGLSDFTCGLRIGHVLGAWPQKLYHFTLIFLLSLFIRHFTRVRAAQRYSKARAGGLLDSLRVLFNPANIATTR